MRNGSCRRFLLAFVCLITWANQGYSADAPLVADAAKSYYWSATNCCGLVAVYVVQNSLGMQIEVQRLASMLPISTHGTSMLAMLEHLRGQDLACEARELALDDLLSALSAKGQWAICLVDKGFGHHWVAAKLTSAGKIAYYDYPRWTIANRADFGRTFMNKAILVSRPGRKWLDPRLLGLPLYVLPALIICGICRRVMVKGQSRAASNNLAFAAFVCTATLVSITCGCERVPSSPIRIHPQRIDLGEIDLSRPQSLVADCHFTIENGTNASQIIEAVETTCGCLTPKTRFPLKIGPKETCTIPLKVAFSPTLHEGQFSKLLRIEASTVGLRPEDSVVRIEAKIKAAAQLTVHPARVDLARLGAWEERRIDFQLSRTGGPLDPHSVGLSGPGRLLSVERLGSNILKCQVEVSGAGLPGKFSDTLTFKTARGVVTIPVVGTRCGNDLVCDQSILVLKRPNDVKRLVIRYPRDRPHNMQADAEHFSARIKQINHPRPGYVHVDVDLGHVGSKGGTLTLNTSGQYEPLVFDVFSVVTQ